MGSIYTLLRFECNSNRQIITIRISSKRNEKQSLIKCKKIYALYKRLCDFSHGSYIELSKYQNLMNIQQKKIYVC